MVDKLWYDWQNKDQKNRYAFLGGSVAVFGEPTFDTFRSGAPPFLNVSSLSPILLSSALNRFLVCLTTARRRVVVEKLTILGCDEHQRRSLDVRIQLVSFPPPWTLFYVGSLGLCFFGLFFYITYMLYMLRRN